MSSSRYKLPYTDNLGDYLSPRNRFLYVHEFHTMDMTTIYDQEGNILYSWSADSDEEAKLLASIISDQEAVDRLDAEGWGDWKPKE